LTNAPRHAILIISRKALTGRRASGSDL